ncbi:MAG: hypothetical protein L0387_35360, partial [Acidobacteria bacterium]|nr:hypothetical protein [Acidobacteriota bacterium]
ETKRAIDAATLGARESSPPRSGRRPLRGPAATLAGGTPGGTPALPGWASPVQKMSSLQGRAAALLYFWSERGASRLTAGGIPTSLYHGQVTIAFTGLAGSTPVRQKGWVRFHRALNNEPDARRLSHQFHITLL